MPLPEAQAAEVSTEVTDVLTRFLAVSFQPIGRLCVADLPHNLATAQACTLQAPTLSRYSATSSMGSQKRQRLTRFRPLSSSRPESYATRK
jgi:hypothetical protein